MRIWPALFGMCCWVPVAWAQVSWPEDVRAYLDAKGPIRLCVAPDWMPMEGIDEAGRHTGMAADFFELMIARGGLDVQLVPTLSWDESWSRAQRRECDALSLLMESPERLARFDFTTPYLTIPGVIATSAAVPFVAGLEQVLDRPLGHMRGFAGIELLRARHPHIHLVEVDSYEEGLMRVQAGELFGMLGNMASIGYALQRMAAVDLKVAGHTGNDSRMSVATRNDEPLLHAAFQILVESIDARERQDIMNRWLAVRFEHGFDYQLLWRTLAVALLAALLVTWWAGKLRQLNRRLAAANRRLDELNRRDPLTGLYNRMHFDATLATTTRSCSRHGLAMALAMIDVDRFKALNDGYGHPFGDACLRRVATMLNESFRRGTDAVFRFGGEEFAVITTGAGQDAVAARLDAFRRAVEGAEIEADGRSARLTVSMGLWCGVPEPGTDPHTLLKQADQALYRAKGDGRNRLAYGASV